MVTEEQVMGALKDVKYPGFSRDIISFGLVKDVKITGEQVALTLKVTTSDDAVVRSLDEGVKQAVGKLEGVSEVLVHANVQAPVKVAAQTGQAEKNRIEGVKHIIAVGSGKGGVGKSTVAANLTAAFHTLGLKVGLCDCDMYGPSMGLMFGADERPTMAGEDKINPVVKNGIRLMSMGFLVEDDSPVILRGPMVTRYTQQFLNSVEWGQLDILVLDLPPGTGDIQLTIVQTVALTGAVVVSTPQEVALIDARKAVKMFEKVNVRVLGMIENMSYFLCPSDHKEYYIFGEGGGKAEAARLKVPLLAQVPIDIPSREAGDSGMPIVLKDQKNRVSQVFFNAAKQLQPVLS
ncbi:MAG: Mrp/NBP35 family ATP-binding protein [Verrucomicrobiota bacterium]